MLSFLLLGLIGGGPVRWLVRAEDTGRDCILGSPLKAASPRYLGQQVQPGPATLTTGTAQAGPQELRSTECQYCCSSCPSIGSSTGPSSSTAFIGLAEQTGWLALARVAAGGGRPAAVPGCPAHGPAFSSAQQSTAAARRRGASPLPPPDFWKLKYTVPFETKKTV